MRNSRTAFYTGDYRALEGEFASCVSRVRSSDTLRPIVVIVTSRLLGLHLSRLLAETGRPHINLRFMTIEDLADRVAGPVIRAEGKTPMPVFAARAAVADVLASFADKPGAFYFARIAERPGFHEAILSTIRDLEEAVLSPEDLGEALRDPSAADVLHISKIEDVVRVWRGYRDLVESMDWIDSPEVIKQATHLLPEASLIEEAACILVYGFYDLNALQQRLLEACTDLKDVTFFVPFENGRAFDFAAPMPAWIRSLGATEKTARKAAVGSPVLAHLRQHLFDSRATVANHEDAVTFISAPGRVREVREITRSVVGAADAGSTEYHEVGILLRDPASYGGLFKEAFEHIGLNPYLPAGTALSDTPDGRALLLLLDILAQDYARSKVTEFVTFAQIRPDLLEDASGNSISVHRWDVASMVAGIVEGREEWKGRLQRLQKELEKDPCDARDADRRARAHGFNVEDVATLGRFVEKLTASLEAVRRAKTWVRKSSLLLDTFKTLAVPGEAWDQVAGSVSELGLLDRIGSPPRQADFQRAVGDLLDGESIPMGRFQRQGPAVVSLETARGISFKTVYIPGLAEKAFPPIIRQDAILLDREREALNAILGRNGKGPLHLKSTRRLEEERLLFRHAVGAAREGLVLTFPRLAEGTTRDRLPSSFILAVVEALTGRKAYFDTVEKTPGFRRVLISNIADPEPTRALDRMEFDLSVAVKSIGESSSEDILGLSRQSALFSAALRMEAARWGSRSFTEYDGLLNGAEASRQLKARYKLADRKMSPTRLETYAGCPFAYLVGDIMGIEPLEEPERAETISALDRGKMVHSILCEFFTSLGRLRGGDLQLRRGDLGLLHKIALAQFAEFEENGVTGYPLMWELEKERILVCLGEFIEDELGRDDMLPSYFEVSYGMKTCGSQEGDISTEEPVPFAFGKRRVFLRGRIDRIDVSPDGRRIRVIDYKTGKARAEANDFQGGTALQLPLYLHAARHILERAYPGIEDLSAEYYHLTEQTDSKRHIGFSGDCLGLKKDELTSIVTTIADGIETGIFLPLPNDQCTWCGFSEACGSYCRHIFERKCEDPRVAGFLRMRGLIDDEVPEESDQ